MVTTIYFLFICYLTSNETKLVNYILHNMKFHKNIEKKYILYTACIINYNLFLSASLASLLTRFPFFTPFQQNDNTFGILPHLYTGIRQHYIDIFPPPIA